MSDSQVHVISTGTANLASVEAGLRRCGRQPVRVDAAAQILDAELLVVPGVGTLAAACQRLDSQGFIEPLRERLRLGTPTLAICLGMQLLADGSEESPDDAGLGILRGRARRFPASVRVPQIGWNRVTPEAGIEWTAPGFAYFANSYYLAEDPRDGWKCLWSEHEVDFLAAAARGRILACQFHPELSGAWGQTLLMWWLEGGVA
jgi:glutamine amidotransferase